MLARTHPPTLDERAFLAADQTRIEPATLAYLREVDALIAAARSRMARLDEGAALKELARASELSERALAVPGAAAFYAEVQLQIGVTAAQLGSSELASAAFARAACVDPTRHLLAGEAAPEVVALATRAFERAGSAPEGEVPIAVDAPRARVFVDDVERGAAPLVVRARTGLHVLRIEAEGRTPYAGLFELAEGRRPEQQFALFASPRAAAALRLSRLRARGDAASLQGAVAGLLQAAPELAGVVWSQRAKRGARSVLFACERSGCRAPLRVTAGATPAWPRAHAALSDTLLASARVWLQHGDAFVRAERAEPNAALWQRWYFWPIVGAAALAGVSLAVTAARPDPQRTLRVTVDPSALH